MSKSSERLERASKAGSRSCLFVRGDHEQSKRNDREQKHAGDEEKRIPKSPGGEESRQAPHDRQGSLHDGGSPVARREDPHGELGAAGHPSRMLHRVDVQGGAREETRRHSRREKKDQSGRSIPPGLAAGVTPGSGGPGVERDGGVGVAGA